MYELMYVCMCKVDLYNTARGVEILSKMSKLKSEAEQIGDVTLTLLLPIRAIMR